MVLNLLGIVCLLTYSVQSAIFAVSIRYSRVRTDQMYTASTAVLNTEILKLLVSLFLLWREERFSVHRLQEALVQNIYLQPLETSKVFVPSFVYVLQNNLLYFAASLIDSATFQITFQLKILTTAFFSVILLGKRLSPCQYFSLLILFVGVIIVELSSTEDRKGELDRDDRRLLGCLATFGAACCSGFAGVYFERVLKKEKVVVNCEGLKDTHTQPQSLWLRNVQLALSSIPIAFVVCFASTESRETVQKKGFFYGYDSFVIYLICFQCFGGILVGMVMKYSDNLAKGFAAASSIVLSCVASTIFFDLHLPAHFILGAALIVISTILYSFTHPKICVNNKAERINVLVK